jgi:UDP-3-O-[3-hydroxymyristoyl] glucosamine N-acyltransferase
VVSDPFLPAAGHSRAAAFLVARQIPDLDRPQIVVPNPAYAAACAGAQFFTAPYRPAASPGRWRGARVTIGAQPSIWPFVTLGDRVRWAIR